MVRTRFALLAVTLLSLLAGYGIRTSLSSSPVDERAYLSELVPGARFSPKQGNPPVYRADTGAIAFNTYDLAPHIRGYAGPIKVLLAMDSSGKITGLRIIEHHETKNYVHYLEMPAYLAQFIGKTASDLFEVDRDVDGISRATVSVKALAETIKQSSRIAAVNALGMELAADTGRGKNDLTGVWYAALFAFAAAGYVLTRRSNRLHRLRDVSLVSGILVIGLVLSSPFSILQVLNFLLLRPSSSILWYVLVFSTLLSLGVAGRFYCGWLCPFGALSEFIGRVRTRKWDIPSETDDRWRKLKYVLLGLVVTIVLLSGRVDYGNFETYVTLFSFSGTMFTWPLVGLALLANLRVKRFWCRYLCPVAAFTGLLSRDAKGYPSRSDCPMANKPGPLMSECIRCNRCYTPVGAPSD